MNDNESAINYKEFAEGAIVYLRSRNDIVLFKETQISELEEALETGNQLRSDPFVVSADKLAVKLNLLRSVVDDDLDEKPLSYASSLIVIKWNDSIQATVESWASGNNLAAKDAEDAFLRHIQKFLNEPFVNLKNGRRF